MSRALSPDRLGQVISNVQGGGVSQNVQADSAPGPALPAPTTVSAAEMVYESRQRSAAVSEGVASAGAPQAVVGECQAEGPGDAAVSGPLGFQGETSGQTGVPGGGSNYGDDGSPMDAQASALLPGLGVAAVWPGGGGPSHIASHAKRKISEMGEVGESPAAVPQQQQHQQQQHQGQQHGAAAALPPAPAAGAFHR